ncbi:putative permease YjgP/YjgQ family protein [Poriferisphaera corsica]|uniref:Putative permease YjgP/YjgQ family protein n=1 Tax=Poriferisphaera corsica TaxID=2528020 RepID=A0A517YVE0_9BACT|nr:LptF/LptG family permease [Poriferisphaera corsica]QDU34142.1 putative permease YjgP/YjgQ family protein [Poriferisphaera corsica]
MKTLSLYIIKNFLVNFVILLSVLMLLFILVDLTINMDDFVKAGGNWAKMQNVTSVASEYNVSGELLTELLDDGASNPLIASELDLNVNQVSQIKHAIQPGSFMSFIGVMYYIIDYYTPIMLLIYIFFSGLIVTAAMGFTFSAMIRARELTAIIASGISLYRIAMPIVLVGGVLSIINLPLQEYAIPAMAERITRDKLDLKRNKTRDIPIVFARDGEGNLISGANFLKDEEQFDKGISILVRDDSGLTLQQIRASQASWDDNRGGWKLVQGVAFVTPDNPMEISPPEAIDFFKTDLSPTVLKLRQTSFYRNLLSIGNLQSMRSNPALSGNAAEGITRIIWSRFSLVILNVIVLVIGLPYFLTRIPGNMLKQGLKAAGACVGAWAGGILVLQAGSSYLGPASAAWLPVIINLPISAYLLHTIKS